MKTGILSFVLVTASLLTGCDRLTGGGHPAKPFTDTQAPPAPDYSQPTAWLAWPENPGIERLAPPNETAIVQDAATADVFFIHPTTYLKNDVWNVAIDAPTTYGDPVLLNQASIFNGCRRIFLPHYRQASLYALTNSKPALDLAYSDVERAFRWYLDHENHDRPFIIASHSQGSNHAIRLLQKMIIGTPLQKKLVAAYVIGAYVPSNFGDIGLPVCDSPTRTGCIIAWNASQSGRTGAYRLTRHATYWWQGDWKSTDQPQALCVNPLTWLPGQAAQPEANLGSEPMPKGRDPAAATLVPLVPTLTGARCNDDLLEVDVSWFHSGFHGLLSVVYGSYHLVDYGLFYENIRRNAAERVAAWHPD